MFPRLTARGMLLLSCPKHQHNGSQVIEFPDLPPDFRNLCTTRLIRFCHEKRQNPECLSISGLQRLGAFAVTSGGYGDVWEGLLRGQRVSVKILKIYQQSDMRALVKVCADPLRTL